VGEKGKEEVKGMGGRERKEREGEERMVEGKGWEGRGGEEDFRSFPEFQICYYTTARKS